MIELNINIKNSETKMSERHSAQGIKLSRDDPRLLELVENAMIKFKAASDPGDEDYEIVVKAKMLWQA
jgi:hypothetical protein